MCNIAGAEKDRSAKEIGSRRNRNKEEKKEKGNFMAEQEQEKV
jgi:hypothetical protein